MKGTVCAPEQLMETGGCGQTRAQRWRRVNCASAVPGASLVLNRMAKSPNEAASGGGSLDPEEAERLAALFRPSWEAPPPEPAGPTAPVNGSARPGSERPSKAASSAPGATSSSVANGAAATPKKTLMGVPAPAALAPEPAASQSGTRSPSPPVERSDRTTQPPVHQRPSRQALSEAPPAASKSRPRTSTPSPPRAAVSARPEPGSSPSAAKPTGVAKAYVPKEAPDTPAVVVDQEMLRAGEAAAAEEEAARRARLKARRHAATVPGSRALEEAIRAALPNRRRRRARFAAAALVAAGLAGAAVAGLGALESKPSPNDATPEDVATPVETMPPAAALHVPPPPPATASEPEPEPVSVEALPTEAEVASSEAGSNKPSGRTAPSRTTADTSEARAKDKDADAPRRSTAEKRQEKEAGTTTKRESRSTASTRSTAEEPSKRKKSVIVRDTPF